MAHQKNGFDVPALSGEEWSQSAPRGGSETQRGGNTMRQYSVLPRRPLQPQTSFHVPCQDLPPRVTLDDPAVAVMTDFRRLPPSPSIPTSASIPRRA
jgi:hypothetical protein